MKQVSVSRERRALRALHARDSGLADFVQRTGWSDFYADRPPRRRKKRNPHGRCPDTIDLFLGTEWAASTETETAHRVSHPSPEKGSAHD